MGDRLAPCPRTEELAPELALGLLTGAERADALVHVAACPACRAAVDDLAGVADQLLLLAPTAEPPAGFESAVLAGIGLPSTARPTRQMAHRLLLGAAALFVLSLAIGVLVGWALTGEPAQARAATMLTPTGREVGNAWVHDGEQPWLLVSVPAWHRWENQVGRPLHYRLRVEVDDGDPVEVPGVVFSDDGSWGTTVALEPSTVRAVSVVDDSGFVWCTGQFG